MNRNPNDATLLAAMARRASRKPTCAPPLTNQRVSFEDALAYAEEADRRDGTVQPYTASRAQSVCIDRVWSLLSDDREWLAAVWVDADGRYHIARELDGNERPIERRPS